MMNAEAGNPVEQAAADVTTLLNQLPGLRHVVDVAERAASDLLAPRRDESVQVMRAE
jgi:hypothetical protein